MSTKTTPKRCFAAIPARAIGDQRLQTSHLRILGAVAVHDRFSRDTRGQGCWVGWKRIAAITGCHEKSVSRTIKDLVDYGYVMRDRQTTDRRLCILQVVYTDGDQAAMALESVTSPLPNGQKIGNMDGEIGNMGSENVPELQGDTDHENIPLEYSALRFASPSPVANPREIHSAEAACVKNDARTDVDLPVGNARSQGTEPTPNDGKILRELRQLDGWLKAPDQRLPKLSELPVLRKWENRCSALSEEYEAHNGHPIGGMACRLGSELSYLIRECEEFYGIEETANDD